MRYAVLCGAMLFGSIASAQSVSFGVHGNVVNFQIPSEVRQFVGLNPPANPQALALEQIYGVGYGGGLHLDVNIAVLSVRISGDYISISPDNDKFRDFLKTYLPGAVANVNVEGGRISVISGHANLKLTILPVPVFRPYLTGGIGLARVQAEDVKITFNNIPLPPQRLLNEETVMMLNGGVGLDLAFPGLALFAEVRVTAFFLEPKTATYLPVGTVGLTF